MEHLYTPWRSAYVSRKPVKPGTKKKSGCFLCESAKSSRDQENLIVRRLSHGFAILNLYPYNDGHLMIAPYRHIGDPNELSREEWGEMHELSRMALGVLKKTLHAEGFNIGMNLGKVAGAGVEEHLHLHVVPRWFGDTNFMPILAQTKMMNQDLKKLYKVLKPAFPT